ncbi:MAG: hypothetical protein Q8K32_04995 [Archangium sp.]|nr:hypothetical protein [Archangium sp.]
MSFLLSLFILAATPECTTSTDGGTVINCGGAKVLVSLAQGAPAQALPSVVEGMSRLYTAVEKRDVEVQLGKQRLRAVDLTLFASEKDKKAIGTARITAVLEREGISRVLVCVTETAVAPELCQRGFETAMTVKNPTAPEPVIPDGKKTWTGVALTTPAGCTSNEPGAIECKTASLMWGDRPPDGPLNSQKVLAELALKQMPPGSARVDRVCRIGGKPSTCSVLSGTANKAPFNIIIGVGDRQGRWTSFQCIVLGELRDTVPSPCDQLVSLEKP